MFFVPMCVLLHKFNSHCVQFFTSMHILSHEFNSCCVPSHPCVHVCPFMFCVSVVRHSDLHVSCVAVHMCIPPKIPVYNSNSITIFSVFCINAHPFTQVQFLCPLKSPFNTIPNQSQFQCFSRPCTSFRMSSILIASIHVLSHEFTSCHVHLCPCIHACPFMFCASAVQCSDLCVSCVAVRMRIPNQSYFQCFSHPCTSFRTNSILVASVCILVSMHIWDLCWIDDRLLDD